MRSIRSVLAGATLVLMLVVAPGASAESVTLKGKGDIKKMFADNGKNAVGAKLYGLKKPCDARYFKVVVYWGSKGAYQADAGCYPGGKWVTSLYYLADRRKPEASKKVKCSKFRLTYNSKSKLYQLTIPRSCLGRAPAGVKVTSEGMNAGAVREGKAGPTRTLRRG